MEKSYDAIVAQRVKKRTTSIPILVAGIAHRGGESPKNREWASSSFRSATEMRPNLVRNAFPDIEAYASRPESRTVRLQVGLPGFADRCGTRNRNAVCYTLRNMVRLG
ncbi:hypothetical protein Acr_01g0014470 [Actinidia rufa]|uniref:Uncharacterized protein n=1 Tax=Actinidia rufa TaxID=165716 RepID=A0A7J0E5C5_9ERIC|nr:hypothetical protein Acr_01g0014470 [Actinidia rufa]